MHRTLFYIVTLLSIGGSLTACKKPPWNGDPPQPPPAEAGIGWDMPTGGTIGHNGLLPSVYINNKQIVNSVMQYPLLPSPGKLNPTFQPLLNASKMLADYAISCAVNKGTVTEYGSDSYNADYAYVGYSSLLNTASSWPGASLGAVAQKDLHACIATRLNPQGAEVNIWLGGAHVTQNGDPPFLVDEALWAASIREADTSGGLSLTISVWPSKKVSDSCPNLSDALNTRICGTAYGASGCGLSAHADRSGCKQDSNGHGKCDIDGNGNFVDVIQTSLECESWCSLYPSCTIPEGCSGAGTRCAP